MTSPGFSFPLLPIITEGIPFLHLIIIFSKIGQKKRHSLKCPFLHKLGVTGFEPATSRPPAVHSNQTEPHPVLQFVFIITKFFSKVNALTKNNLLSAHSYGQSSQPPCPFYSLNLLCRPLTAVPYCMNHILIKFRFMADQKDTSTIIQQRFFQGILRVHIQMVRWFVQKQDIGIPIHKFAESYFCLFPST